MLQLLTARNSNRLAVADYSITSVRANAEDSRSIYFFKKIDRGELSNSDPEILDYCTRAVLIGIMSSNTSMDHISPNMSTMSLENRLRQLKEESQKLDHVLTQKLASSQSGQNLLHIGTSLSSLPPDLHLLLQQLHPVLSQAELSEKEQLQQLEQLVQAVRDIKLAERRVQHSQECSDLYQDLIAAEQSVQNKEQVGMRGCRQLMKDSMIASDEAEGTFVPPACRRRPGQCSFRISHFIFPPFQQMHWTMPPH